MAGLNDLPGTRTHRVPITAAMGSATTDDEVVAMQADANLLIKAVRFIPAAAVTANGTNYTVLSLRNRKGDASGTALPASRSWAANNSAAWVPDTATLSSTASDLLVAKGDVLTVQRVHQASGLVIPAGVVEIDYQVR